MQQYKYKAVNLQKEVYEGMFIAKDENELGTELAKQGLYLVSATPYKGGTPSAFFTLGTGKVSLAELNTFCRQFAIMINAGISILGCLEILKEQNFTKYFKSILEIIHEDVKAGLMFSAALEKHKSVFPTFFRSMIAVGETSGKMDVVMNSLADYYERDDAVVRKAKGAFSYPLMLLGMTLAIVVLMLAYVIPTFEDALASMDVALSGFTLIVYSAADWFTLNWMYVLCVIVVVALVFWGVGKTKQGAYFYDWAKLRIPMLKDIQIDLISARFARSFGLLLNSGMDVTEAMEAVTIVLTNKDIEARFKKAAEDVSHGMSLALAFDKYKLFPPILIQMVAIGERTASIDEVLTRSCGYFDDKVERTITGVTSKIQPIMLVIMGAVIGGMFLAVYAPILSIMEGLL